MTLLVAWLVLPALLGVLALGCGLLLQSAFNIRVPGALLLPLGTAMIIAIAHLATSADATAEAAAPAVVGAAAAGYIVSPNWHRVKVNPWIAGAALVVFASYAAPVVLSGQPTLAGFIKLDDTATWLGQIDRLMEHGRSLAGLEASSYEAALDSYLPRGSPVGALFPVGVGSRLLGTDPAWLIQPVMSFYAGMLALALSELVRPVVGEARFRAGVAVVAAQPALLFGYVMWGGIKEIGAAALLALAAATVPVAIAPGAWVRAVPLALASGGVLSVLGPAGGVWLAPMLLAVLGSAIARVGVRETLARSAAFAVLAVALSVPLLTGNAFDAATTSELYAESEIGNLFGPLNSFQVFGIWPVGDFRVSPSVAITVILLGAAIAGLLVGLSRAVRSARSRPLLIYPLAGVVSLAVIFVAGSPWVDAKALATLSPAILMLSLVGAVALSAGGLRPVGVLLTALITVGVVSSNVLAYREVNLAPYEQLRELEQIGDEVAGEGPTLMTTYEPYGVRHFLRDGDPEGVSELRRRQIPLVNGGRVRKGRAADTDELAVDGLLIYRTLVLRRSPEQSRPPSPYGLVERGRYYEIWQRPDGEVPTVERLPLGDSPQATAVAPCRQIEQLAQSAGADGELAYAARPPNVVFALSRFSHPPTWSEPGSEMLYPSSQGSATLDIQLPSAGEWRVWLGGLARGEVQLFVDGNEIGSMRHVFNYFAYADLGVAELGPGVHRVELRYGGPDLHPGSAGAAEALGPLIFTRGEVPDRVETVRSAQADQLCGRRLDWIEVISR